ncbi:hypothetical protein P8452_57798 [Trifolium repens]|nr:hypothetical protein P8452_57798 [Trifolium repens]
MYQAIPYISSHNKKFGNMDENYYYNMKKENLNSSPKGEEKMILNMVSENAVIVIGRHGCCMTHVVKKLLQSLGVNPLIHEVEEEKDEVCVAKELELIIIEEQGNSNVQFPMVFIGGKLFGGLERVMATHISGELVPLLKQAGALWL